MSRLVLTSIGANLDDTVSLDLGSEGSPGIDDVLIEVDAAPINNGDILFAAGLFASYPRLPAAMGAEGVGRVLKIGSQVDPALLGRRVLIMPTFGAGTWATKTVVPARNVIPVPEQTDVLQLAMCSANPATAYALLNDFVRLQRGDWVGFNLANSTVGRSLIALAQRAGIKTLAVVRREDAAVEVRQLGADRVVVDGHDLKGRVAEALSAVRLRVLFEGTGDPSQVAQLVTAVEDGGTVICFAAATGQTPALPLPDLIYRGIILRGFFILNWIRDTPRERLDRVYGEVLELVQRGAIRAAVQGTYPLDQYQKAILHAQEHGHSGKVLFIPNGAPASIEQSHSSRLLHLNTAVK